MRARARLVSVLIVLRALGVEDARATQLTDPADQKAEERSWLDDWSLLPVLFYSPETAVGFGAAVIRSLALPSGNPILSTLSAGVIYTTEGQFITRFEPDLRFGDDAFVHAVFGYQRYPTRFFSEEARASDPGEAYDERSMMGHVDARVTYTGKVRVGLRWEYRHNELTDYVDGGRLEQSGLRGRDPYFASGLGPVVSLDTRDDPRLPTRGVLADAKLLGITIVNGDTAGALQLGVDLRGYIDLGAGHVLAGEIGATLTHGDPPFQLLPQLGGPNFLRGWYAGHLRGRHAFLAQLEWRLPVWKRIGAAAFVGLGETVMRFEQLGFDRVRAGGGLGVRYLLNKRQRVTVRFDLAWGSGLGAYVDVLEAF